MARPWVCDSRAYQQPSPLPFELVQITDETDPDGDPIVIELHLCSPQCLSDFAMGLSLDFGDNEPDS